MIRKTLVLIAVSLIFSAYTWASANEWKIEENDSLTVASVANDDGNHFGLYCQKKSCNYVIIVDVKCEDGEKYPALINSDVGAQSVNLICGYETSNSNYVYFFEDFSTISNVTMKGSILSIVFPMGDNTFQVERFDLSKNLDVLTKFVERVKKKFKNTTFGYKL